MLHRLNIVEPATFLQDSVLAHINSPNSRVDPVAVITENYRKLPNTIEILIFIFNYNSLCKQNTKSQ